MILELKINSTRSLFKNSQTEIINHLFRVPFGKAIENLTDARVLSRTIACENRKMKTCKEPHEGKCKPSCDKEAYMRVYGKNEAMPARNNVIPTWPN